MFNEQDKDTFLKNKNVVIFGYGNQGRPQALNLKDSGINPIIGLRKNSKSIDKAKKDGFKVKNPVEAMNFGDVFVILIPDEAHEGFFKKYVYNNIKKGQTFIFAHGFSIYFKTVKLKNYPVNIGMVAPKGPGTAVRERFLSEKGLPGIIALDKDYTKNLKQILISYSYYAGFLKKGVSETSFKEEVLCDLFGEQVALCGVTVEIMKMAFEILVEKGFSPEMAYYETIFEMKAIIDLIFNKGINGMREKISDTAEFGAYDAVNEIITPSLREKMEKRFDKIENGKFSKKWVEEYKNEKKYMYDKRKKEEKSLICRIEKKMRNRGLL